MTWRELIELIGCIVVALILLIVVLAPNVYLFFMMIYSLVESFLQEQRRSRSRD